MQRVKAKVFIQDPFNPVLFTEDSERYVDVRNIVCALTSYNYSEDILQFEEGDVIILLDVFQHIYQWSRHFCRGSWDSWDQLQPMKHSVSGFQAEERGGSKAVFSTILSKEIWETMPANIFGDQGNLSLNHFREQSVLLMANKR